MTQTDPLVERLRKPLADEDTMKQWDRWASWLREGGHGSLPRDGFEAWADCADDDRREAAARILADAAKIEALVTALEKLTINAVATISAIDEYNKEHSTFLGGSSIFRLAKSIHPTTQALAAAKETDRG